MPYRDSTDGRGWSYSRRAPVIAAAPSARSRVARARHGRVARSVGAMSADRGHDPVVPQDGNGHGHGAGEELALAPGDAFRQHGREVAPDAPRRWSRRRAPRPGSRPGHRPGAPSRSHRRRVAWTCPARRSPAVRAATAPRAGRPPSGPTRREITAVSPASATSIRRTGSACRISSSLLTVAPPVRCSRGPSR